MKKYKADIYLIAVCLFIGVGLLIALYLLKPAGAIVQIRVDGQVVEENSLNQDNEIIVQGVGGGTNRIVIKGGKVYIDEASCPDGLCIHMGPVNRENQSIICLPNKVVVEVVGASDDDSGRSLDAVAR